MQHFDQKKYNTFRVFKKILRDGPISRLDITKSLDLTHASVLTRVNELQEKNIIKTVGFERKKNTGSGKGRYTNLLSYADPLFYAAGFVINSKEIHGYISTLTLQIFEEEKIEFEEFSYDEIINKITDIFNGLVKNNGLNKDEIVGCGVALQNDCFETVGAKMEHGVFTCEKLEKDLTDKFNITFSVNSVAADAGIYYFDKYISGRVTPQNYSVSSIYMGDTIKFSTVSRFAYKQFAEIKERDISKIIVNPSRTGSICLEKNMLGSFITFKTLKSDLKNDPDFNDMENLDKAISGGRSEVTEYVIEKIKNGDDRFEKYVTYALRTAGVALYNAAILCESDKLIVSASDFPAELSDRFRVQFFDALGDKYNELVIFDTEKRPVELGSIIDAYNNGFVPFYFKLM